MTPKARWLPVRPSLSPTRPRDSSRTTKSDGQGDYQFLELPPAKYDLTVDAAGFATMKQSGVELQVATPATLNVTMQVAGGTVTVEVSGTAPLVNTQDASMGHAFGADQIADLPFEGRDPLGFSACRPESSSPATALTSPAHPTAGRRGEWRPQRPDQHHPRRRRQQRSTLGTAFTGAIRAPLDSMEELKVTTSNSDADTGRSSGGQVSVVTKSGTNHVHGSLYVYNRPTFTTANDWFNKAAQIGEG